MSFGDKTYYVGDKVIQLVNDPKLGIMNGDVGIVKYVRKNMDGNWTLTVNYDGNDVVYDKGDLDQLNLAYAMSIHKAQGSEYDIVIMPLVKSYTHMFKKELIYTAMTRAKTTLLLLGDISMLIYASNHQSEKRQTLLPLFLSPSSKDNEKESLSPYDFM
jgi:exodeoxyribonuclease V alpha subunit